MNVKRIIIIGLLILVPAIIFGATSDPTGIIGDQCLVPIYHTNFAFPPQGGSIITAENGQMYFVKDYLPECTDAAAKVAGSTTPEGGVPAGSTNDPFVAPSTGIDDKQDDFLWALDNCLVPVFHIQFNFPPEGGKIVKIGDRMYFVKDYLPGCEHVADGYPIIRPLPHPTPGPVPPPPPGPQPPPPPPGPIPPPPPPPGPTPPPPPPSGPGGSLIDVCFVPVYHIQFAFPPEGGKIVKVRDRMYFVKDYLPECEHVADGFPVIRD